jgi:hypothetical protein
MSIIMEAAERKQIQQTGRQVDDLNLALRSLLDHVAVELAEEYVRLMEAAVTGDAGTAAEAGATPPETGEQRL